MALARVPKVEPSDYILDHVIDVVAVRPVARGVRGCDAPPQICQKVHFLSQSGLKMGFYEGG